MNGYDGNGDVDGGGCRYGFWTIVEWLDSCLPYELAVGCCCYLGEAGDVFCYLLRQRCCCYCYCDGGGGGYGCLRKVRSGGRWFDDCGDCLWLPPCRGTLASATWPPFGERVD